MAKRIYGKTVRELFDDLFADIKLKHGEIIERSKIINWFQQKYPKIKPADKSSDYVVIELKVSKGHDRVVGQLLRYMGWIKQNLANENQKVRGVIVAREITEDLILATSMVQDITLLEYKLKVSLHKVDSAGK
jgi:hypothetical protein